MKHTTYLFRAFVTIALIGALSACVAERQELNSGFGTNGKLSVKGTVSEATVITKAPSVVELKEKQLNTLDVFVEHVSNEDAGKFIKQYHLVASAEKPITEELNLLAEHWRQEGLAIDEKYNIYVAVNNTQTKDKKDLTKFNVEVLKSLVADEVTDEIAVIQKDGTIGWKGNSTSGNIYKLYDANPGDARALTSEKAFMMDGVIKNWTPDPAKTDQVFDVTLNRAASKFVLNVNFDADFLQVLSNEGVSITGSPAWKFYNFAFGAPVFAPETQGAGVEVHNSGFNIFHNESCADGKSFTITTYSYPNKWAAADYATAAPSLVISIGFTEGTGDDAVTNYHYYRIPLVKSTVTEIGRNNIYVVNATIATRGSATQEDADITEDIQYAVLPWNDQTNSDVIENNVTSVQHYYFNVNPKVYTLRGDGDQSIVLNYSKATGTKVNWKLFTYDADGNQADVVAKDDANAVRAWFYDNVGNFTTRYGEHTGTSDTSPISYWDNMGVTITQSGEGTTGSKGTVTVTSTALTNKAIKYIRLRVYLDEEATFENDKETMYEDIIIRHFPTDNIQSFTGSWSSRYGAVKKTEGTGYGTNAQFFANPDNYIRTEQTRNNNPNWSGQPANWSNYTSEETAYAGNNNYYYWRTVRGSDWWGNEQYTYHRARYRNAVTTPVTWVDYDLRIDGVRNDDNFIAKVYSGGVMHRINPNSPNWIGSTDNLGGLNNNHMYVVQISSTSDKYILGRPYINAATHQSYDNVVSPAFMIASQLGAVTPYQGAGADAATHCSTYMEVGDDANRTRYTGWRLPTPAEIEVITGYQQGDIDNVHIPTEYRVMREVLTGSTYWALNGEEISTGYSTTYSGYVRCVRDLSAKEVEELNGFDKIQEKYR